MDGTEQLCSLDSTKIRKQTKSNRPQRLGDTLNELLENRISPLHNRFGPLIKIWQQILPAELSKYCRVSEISAGELKVMVDSPTYMHEMRLCSGELLSELQRLCPTARIKKIKLVINHKPKIVNKT